MWVSSYREWKSVLARLLLALLRLEQAEALAQNVLNLDGGVRRERHVRH